MGFTGNIASLAQSAAANIAKDLPKPPVKAPPADNAMARRLQAEAVPGPQAPGGAPSPTSPAAPKGPLPQFEIMRKQAASRADASAQQGQDALQRRFAAMGGLNSGSAIKATQLGAEAASRQKEDAIGGIDAQEAAERSRLDEAQTNRDFASGEARVGREFSAQESARGRNMQREFANADQDFKDRVFNFESGTRLRELDMADRQFGLDKENHEFNLAQARAEANEPDAIEKYMGYLSGSNLTGGGGRGGGGSVGGTLARGAGAIFGGPIGKLASIF